MSTNLDHINFPCVVECYRLVAKDDQPPMPEDSPVMKQTVRNLDELNQAKEHMKAAHPDGWIMERPIY